MDTKDGYSPIEFEDKHTLEPKDGYVPIEFKDLNDSTQHKDGYTPIEFKYLNDSTEHKDGYKPIEFKDLNDSTEHEDGYKPIEFKNGHPNNNQPAPIPKAIEISTENTAELEISNVQDLEYYSIDESNSTLVAQQVLTDGIVLQKYDFIDTLPETLPDMLPEILPEYHGKPLEDTDQIQNVIICDGCKTTITHLERYKCLKCEDFDFCTSCFITKTHANNKHLFQPINLKAIPKDLLLISEMNTTKNNTNLGTLYKKEIDATNQMHESFITRYFSTPESSKKKKIVEESLTLVESLRTQVGFREDEEPAFYAWMHNAAEVNRLKTELRRRKEELAVTLNFKKYLDKNGMLSISCKLFHIPPSLFLRQQLRFIKCLNLECNNLEDIPDTIIHLESLQVINLSGNKLSTLPPMHTLTSVEVLDLCLNRFSEFPVSVCSLTSLLFLNLQGNELLDLPSTLTNLQQLQTLNLGMNPFNFIPDCVTKLPSLVSLRINGDSPLGSSFQPKDLSPGLLRLLEDDHTIRKLYALECAFKYTDHINTVPDGLFSLSNLTDLRIVAQKITTLPLVAHLHNLQVLGLGCNSFTVVPPVIYTLTNLVELALPYNSITSLDPSLSNLINLKNLYMGYNKLTSLPDTFSTLQSLEILHLADNKLTTLPHGFYHLSNLHTLRLESNPLPDQIIRLSVQHIALLLCNLYKQETGMKDAPMWSRDLIPDSEIVQKEKIGSEQDMVYRGIWRRNGIDNDVCIKPLSREYVADFAVEMGILARLRPVANTVYFFGFCENPLRIVMEFVPAGSLADKITKLRERNESLSPVQQVGILLDCCIGMTEVHREIFHLDLHSGNIFLTDDLLHAKIGDFGLSRTFEMVDLPINHARIRPPEVWRNEIDKPSASVDVYAFSVIIWEVLSGKVAYEGMNQNEIGRFVANGNRLPTPLAIATWQTDLVSIMNRCASEIAAERPTFRELRNEISTIASEVMGERKFYAWEQFSHKQNELRSSDNYC